MPVDLGRFNSTLVYSRRASIDALLEDLAELRAFDGKQEKILTVWTIVGTIGLLGAIASIFLANSSQCRTVVSTAWYCDHRCFRGDDGRRFCPRDGLVRVAEPRGSPL